MKAGHNMHAGLETIAQETFDPVRMEFKKVIEELALGAPLDETLHGLGRRIPLIDLKFFITGLILQRQTVFMPIWCRCWRTWRNAGARAPEAWPPR